MTEIQTYRPANEIGTVETRATGAALIREAAEVMATAHALAEAICKTAMVPKHFQGNADGCAAAMLYGASLGLDPMQSVKAVYVVHGNAALYASAMAAIVRRDGHKLWTVETSDESVTVAGRRRGETEPEIRTWDLDRATRAGYTSNEKYKTNPQQMLYAKAVTEVCRVIAPDSLAGVYAAEELELEHVAGQVLNVEQVVRPTRGLAAALEEKQPEPAIATEAPLLDTRSSLARAMYAGIHEAGIPDDDRIEFINGTIGRAVSSTKEMTTVEAQVVLDALATLKAQEQV